MYFHSVYSLLFCNVLLHFIFFFYFTQILDELLKKLEIEHVIWSGDKNGNYYQVIFPLQSGDPCETTLHCLTELGIGTKLNSTVR